MTLKSKLSTDGDLFFDVTLYRSLVGALQYVTFTCLDVAYDVQQARLFMHDRSALHFLSLKCILGYLKGNLTHGLHICFPTVDRLVYLEADWASCPSAHRHTIGFCVYLGDN